MLKLETFERKGTNPQISTKCFRKKTKLSGEDGHLWCLQERKKAVFVNSWDPCLFDSCIQLFAPLDYHSPRIYFHITKKKKSIKEYEDKEEETIVE